MSEEKNELTPMPDSNEIVVTKRKKNLLEKTKEAFVMEDISTVWNEAKRNVVIPGFKRVVASTLHAIINGIFSGEVSDSSTVSYGKSNNDSRLISYDDYYGRNRQNNQTRNDYRGRERARKDISSYTFKTEDDAQLTLEWMNRSIRTNKEGYLTVAEWYDHFHVKSEWTDYSWCWRDLSGAKVMPNMTGGFYLLLPRPEPIN